MRLVTRRSIWIKVGVAALSALCAVGLGLVLVRKRAPPPLVENVVATGIDWVFEQRDRLLAEQPDLGVDDPLGRFTIPEDWARELFPPIKRDHRYDPLCYYTRAHGSSYRQTFREHPAGKWQFKANALGLRGDPLVIDPDLRILVTGDSHTEGACPLEDRFTSRMQEALRSEMDCKVEVLNAAVGGFGFYNYLGIFEKFRYLEPQLFVVVVYGGNDFLDSLLVHHLFAGTRRSLTDAAYKDALDRALAVFEPALSQEYLQLVFLNRHPAEREIAQEAARDITLEIQRVCREANVPLLVVYLPPLGNVQRARYEPVMTDVAKALELTENELGLADRMADEWMSAVADAGVEVLDLRPAFREAQADLYWHTEHHISSAGHALVAEELLRAVRAMDL